jgi:hypothetical protein
MPRRWIAAWVLLGALAGAGAASAFLML